jgi:hypothetical protein
MSNMQTQAKSYVKICRKYANQYVKYAQYAIKYANKYAKKRKNMQENM